MFYSNDLKSSQNYCLDKISDEFEFGLPGIIKVVYYYLVDQIKEIPFGHSRGHISCSIDQKITQNVRLPQISDKFEFGSSGGHKLGN